MTTETIYQILGFERQPHQVRFILFKQGGYNDDERYEIPYQLSGKEAEEGLDSGKFIILVQGKNMTHYFIEGSSRSYMDVHLEFNPNFVEDPIILPKSAFWECPDCDYQTSGGAYGEASLLISHIRDEHGRIYSHQQMLDAKDVSRSNK